MKYSYTHFQATACQTMPSPPKSTGLIDYSTTSSEEARYNPSMPTSLTLPPGGICGGRVKLLVVGTIPSKSKKNFEAIVKGASAADEAFHAEISVTEEVVWR